MKRISFIILCILFVCSISSLALADKTCTIMVYMCGSNLESNYGAATQDIEEIMLSGFDEDFISFLVMTGGSKSWDLGLDSNQTTISEINADGFQPVWNSTENLNMGEPSSLTFFLQFCMQNYPADSYALILWNHGGGPLGGVCWDELFSMDNLSLSELVKGLHDAGLPEKLSWIGFDACLMGSIEVAYALSPYAEYMIASQETEPASGWNYDFLAELDADDDGASVGIKIVNSFFQVNKQSTDTLTLSCLSLSSIDEVINKMDSYFHSLSESVDDDHFASLSDVLRNTTGFGKGVRGLDNGGYDLVDLTDLIQRNIQNNKPMELEKALASIIVYSQSNIDGANGLSVYHPYTNKRKYLNQWHDDYLDLRFCPGYTEYIERFGSILTDDPLEQWQGLSAQERAVSSESDHFFSLQLTKEQVANFSSAQMLILESLEEQAGNNTYQLVSSVPAFLNENGEISATYTGRTLYAEVEDGSLVGPLSLLLTQDAKHFILYTVYLPKESISITDSQRVIYYIDSIDSKETPTIIQRRVLDEATGVFSNRLSFSEENMRSAYFWDFTRVLPIEKERIPAYLSWPSKKGYISAQGIELPQKWKLRYINHQISGAELYATFQITDIQQNSFCTNPIPIKNPNLSPFSIQFHKESDQPENVSIKGKINSSETDPVVRITLRVTNNASEKMEYRFRNFVVNGNRLADESTYFSLSPNEAESRAVEFTPLELFGIDEIYSISCLMETENRVTGENLQAELLFDVDGCDLRKIIPAEEPLAEVALNEENWKLLSVKQADLGGIEGTFLVNNQGSTETFINGSVLLNGICAESGISGRIPAGMEKAIPFFAKNKVLLDSFAFPIAGINNIIYDTILSEHILQKRNENAIHEIQLLIRQSPNDYMFDAHSQVQISV